jgi:cysteinyl-tRNA synthetase
LEELQAASREDLEGTNEKRFHADFALWKKAQPEHIMQWSSPWGQGFPGWHIECTAMSSKYLGIPFDIHGGGMDLKFPHHEAEICQSLGAYYKQPVNYWLHNYMVTLNGQKMAKSKGNFITLKELFTGSHELIERAYSPMVVRFFILQAHYGSTIDFSNESLIAAESALKKLAQSFKKLDLIPIPSSKQGEEAFEKEVSKAIERCYEGMNDDFNTAKLIAALFELSKIINRLSDNPGEPAISKDCFEKLATTFTHFWTEVLGIQEESKTDDKLDEVMNVLIELRQQAKVEKKYAYSDFIRKKLEDVGVQLQDGKDGQATYLVK